MSGITSAIARVKELQNRTGTDRPSQTGDFQAALDKASDEATRSSVLAVPRTTPPAAYTIGQLIGTGPAVPLAGPPIIIHRPPVAGVLTGAELGSYLEQVGVTPRNGRLVPAELTPISGGWNGQPGGLLEPAAIGWEKMREAAAEDGIDLRFVDSYRTWEAQHAAHQRYLRGDKIEHVLPAGTSEHGRGLAVDITDGAIIRQDDEEWRWLQGNAPAFGWWPISNESWHWEFRGTES